MTRFTIVIPTRNRSEKLSRALLSLTEQTYQPHEVIVIDDHSEENLKQVCDKYNNLNIKLLKSKKNGANAARNLGTIEATGDYICYLDSDDYFLKKKLEAINTKITEADYDVVISKLFVWRGVRHNTIRPDYFPKKDENISEYIFVNDQRLQTSSICIKTDIAQQVLWNEALPKIQDPDFIIRTFSLDIKPLYIDEPLAVLEDIPSDNRISQKNYYKEIDDWLNRKDNPLSDRARKYFKSTILPVEKSKKSKIKANFEAIKFLSPSTCRQVIKTLLQINTRPSTFKKIGHMIKPKPSLGLDHEINELMTRNI